MNYYNPYLSYPFTNNGIPQFNAPMNAFQPQSAIPTPQTQQAVQMTGLNGKIVDSEDVVKATEVPIGGYGIFPKADLSEIYVKSWNNNGTPSVITFQPVAPPPASTPAAPDNSMILQLCQKIDNVESKIDSFIQNTLSNKTTIRDKEKEGILSGL